MTATERRQLLPLSLSLPFSLSPSDCTFLLQQPGTVQKAFCPPALREFAFTWRSERDPNPKSNSLNGSKKFNAASPHTPPSPPSRSPLCLLLYPFVRRSIDFQLQNKHNTQNSPKQNEKKTKAKEKNAAEFILYFRVAFAVAVVVGYMI